MLWNIIKEFSCSYIAFYNYCDFVNDKFKFNVYSLYPLLDYLINKQIKTYVSNFSMPISIELEPIIIFVYTCNYNFE